jgi:3alpha(or 20beta)-hydroxysteroid dehydrogenase
MGRMAGKIAMVTGGARGLGAYDCYEFAREGADTIIIADILLEEMEQTAEKLQQEFGCNVVCKPLDVTKEDQWMQLVSEIDETFGKLDVLVNNAGIVKRVTMLECSLEDWNNIIDVNQTGVFLGIKHCAPLMKKSGAASIINISSIAGLTGYFAWPYTATKWAVRGMTKAAAMELSDWKIRVNSIHPGFTWTDMTTGAKDMIDGFTNAVALERAGNPEEIAKAVLFLASDESSFITGTELVVDGGFQGGGGIRNLTKKMGLYHLED